MAVQEQTPLREYTANGATTSFALGFDCEETNHLIVTIDDVEVLPTDWYLSGSNVVFWNAPGNGKLIKLQRNTPFNRLVDYQSYNNSFRPPAINKEFDRIWWKLQELGVADWILGSRIDALKNYVDRKDDELKAYLMEEIRKQGVALDQLDEYYNYLMQRLAQIAVDKGWDASFVVDASGKTQQEINDNQAQINARTVTPYHFGGIGDGTYHPLSERYTTLAEAQEAYPFVTSLEESIDACALEKFFNFCDVNFVENASITFNAYITKPIIRLIRNPKTKVYFGDLTLYSEHQMEYMLRLAGDHCKYFGTIRVSGKEVTSYVNRNIKDGIICGGDNVYFMNSYIESVVGICLQGTAITLHQNCHFTKVNRAESSRCGSCLIGSSNHSLEANILGRSDIGTTIDQRTTLTVDKLPVITSVVGGGVYDRRNGIFAVINSEIYEVYEIGADSITVYPRVDSEITTGSLKYIFGGTVALAGNNTAHTSVDKIHAITSGIGLSCRSLYGLSVNTLTTEYCGIGLLVGNRGGAHIGTTIGSFYAEANDFDRVDSWTSNYNAVRILEDIAVNTSKVISLYDYRGISSNNRASVSSLDYGRLNVGEFSKAGRSYNAASTLDAKNNIVSITDDYNVIAFSATNVAFEVTANADLFRLFKNRFTLINCSSFAGNTKPATLKIRCAVDKTIAGLGSPTVVVVGGVSKNEYTINTAKYTKTIQIALYYNYTDSNFGASILTATDHAVSVPYTPPSIPADGEVTTTVVMDGVYVGNIVYAAFSRYNENVEIYSTVSATNTVTVKFKNTGATAVDFLSGTLTVKAI